MLGSEEEARAYREKIERIMREAVEETRAARRQPPRPDQGPVMIGNAGMPGGITSA